jgi:hypothetical protein
MHACDNKVCVNPDHLTLGTQQQNIRDAVLVGALAHQLLMPDDVREIRTRLSSGAKGIDLASEYGVTPSTISDIKRGKSWAWLS